MNREIKFRAWDKKHNRMKNESLLIQFDLQSGNAVYGMEREDGENVPYWPDEAEIMQYTGLKDKNGKEIYEGDILEMEVDDEFSFMSAAKDRRITREVTWQINYGAGWNFGQSHKDGDKRWSYPFYQQECEVIGNIYENPELLTK